MDDNRRPPEHFLALIREQERGRLKVYLGFAPGVGKTYLMLQEGQRLKEQGVDVVIGFVETHGRADTARQVGNLEQVARRRVEYRSVVLEEMDLDAVLLRRPRVALVDELAHTNAPGSRNAKRYQDVEELLREGINVITTVNIQHLESLYDIIQAFTGVKVKERVPDYVLGQSDQIVNVDLSYEDLQDRLRVGKIYPADRIESALGNFFTGTNLTRLRELAVEEMAHLLERSKQARKEAHQPGGTERVLVCLSSRAPQPEVLLRRGGRLADRLHAPWYIVYVETPGERMERVDAATQRKIDNSLEVAHKLGGIPMKYKGEDFSSTVAAFVQEYGITHIVMGRSQRPWYRRLFGQSPLERLLQKVRGVDVLIVDTG